MRWAIHLLLFVAVLWCGLQLSPAEADVSLTSLSHEISSTVPLTDEDPDGHALPHVPHGCHSHCPIAPIGGLPTLLDVHFPLDALLFAPPVAPLTSALIAPPIEPPAA